MKNITERFEAEIAKAVSIIATASRTVAIEMVDQALGTGGQVREVQKTRKQSQTQRGKASPRSSFRSSKPKRSPAEIAALEERFAKAVWGSPGASMGELASRLQAAPSALQVPVARLKKMGRIKTVGARQFTRYFPTEGCDDPADETGGQTAA